MTHSVSSVFLPNSGFSDTQHPILRRVRNDFFFPKGPILRNGGLGSQWSALCFSGTPPGFTVSVTCSFIHAFPEPVSAQSQPRPAAGGVGEPCNRIPSGIRRVCLAPEAH